jgi:formylmethanofuran dehydrogenase subunit E
MRHVVDVAHLLNGNNIFKMGVFAEDLSQDYGREDHNFNNSPVMCTGCGEVVREDETRFKDGKSCCVYCK